MKQRTCSPTACLKGPSHATSKVSFSVIVDVINGRAFPSKLDADDGDYWRAGFPNMLRLAMLLICTEELSNVFMMERDQRAYHIE